MLRTLQLLLPAVVPSWRFFDYIAPSPRVQYAVLDAHQNLLADWREFDPRPEHVPLTTLLRRMLWNPQWNESLFMMSCAERILEQHTHHSETEIMSRICTALRRQPVAVTGCFVQFRLVVIERRGEQLTEQVYFISRVTALPSAATQ